MYEKNINNIRWDIAHYDPFGIIITDKISRDIAISLVHESNINIRWDIAHGDPFGVVITDKISWDIAHCDPHGVIITDKISWDIAHCDPFGMWQDELRLCSLMVPPVCDYIC